MKLPQGDRASTCFCVYQMMMQPKLLDTVALLTQIPQQRLTLVEADSPVVDGLPPGLMGTIRPYLLAAGAQLQIVWLNYKQRFN